MSEFIYIDGDRVKSPLPIRSIFYGEGLFETFRYRKQLPVLFNKHLERMRTGAELLRIPFPGDNYITEQVDKAVYDAGIKDSYVKICLLSNGQSVFYEPANESQLLVIIKDYLAPKDFVKIRECTFRRISDSPLAGVKSLNYQQNILAKREALSSGWDDSIFLNENNEIAECSSSNIFWYKEHNLYTPSVECGILPGTTRELILSIVSGSSISAVEGKFKMNDLINSEYAFITNSLAGCLPVSNVQGTSLHTEVRSFKEIRNKLLEALKWA